MSQPFVSLNSALIPQSGSCNIVAQRLERRDVNNLRFVGQIMFCALPEQRIERSEKRRQRFA